MPMSYPAKLKENSTAEETIGLFLEAADWSGVSDIIMKSASSLKAGGKSKTLEQWLLAMPESVVSANAWLLYWLGNCRADYDLDEALDYLEKALELFRKQDVAEPIYLTWSDLVDTCSLGCEDWRPLDKWLAEFDAIARRHPLIPSPEIEIRVATSRLISLVLRQTGPSEIRKATEKILGLLKETDIGKYLKVYQFLTLHHIWTGNNHKNILLIQELQRKITENQSHPMLAINLKLMEAMHYWLTGQSDLCSHAVSAGLEIAETSGIHEQDYFLLVCNAENALVSGDREVSLDTLATLDRKRVKTLDHVHYHMLSAWQALLDGNINYSLDNMRECEKQIGTLGSLYHESMWHIGIAQVEMARSNRGPVMGHLDTAFEAARKIKSLILMYVALLLYARLFFLQGENEEGVAYLHQAILVGKENGYMHFPWWQPETMADLCAKALENDIEIDFVRELIRKHDLMPETPPMHIETWPWPLKIHTLGSFEIRRDDIPFAFTGKIQKKPLELLKALVSFGAKDVSGERLAAALWPALDGDNARHSLDTTLYRLRKLLGAKALQWKAGRLSLDTRHCWIDTGTFEHLGNAIERETLNQPARQDEKELLRLLEKACGLYRGHFLPTDRDLPWTTQTRERLRSRLRQIVVNAGEYWEKQGQWEKATIWYQRGVEMDGLMEEFYQRLMLCHQKQGQTAEAVMLFRRLRTTLARRLDLAPSPKTNAIYRSITKKKNIYS